jgi:hypothetical protein
MKPTTNAVTITGTGKICAVVNGKSYTVAPDHKNYDKIIESIRSQDYDSFVKLVDVSTAINNAVNGTGIEVSNGQVLFNGTALHNTITTRIIQFMHDDLPFLPLCKFLENLMQNPSFRAVTELYNFLEVGELPITEDGHFLAFKNVRSDYFDIHTGNTCRNMVGDKPFMPRNMVDEDKDKTCSSGLHFCSIKYLPHFSGGSDGHTMIVKVNPRDVVSIPADYNNTKARACTYEVVGEYLENWREKIDNNENGFDAPLYSSDGGDYEGDDEEEVTYGFKPSGHKFYNKRDASGRFA